MSSIWDDDIKRFYVLNTWDEETKKRVRACLENGGKVHLSSSCIGHTRAYMVECNAREWLRDEYKNRLVEKELTGGNVFYLKGKK